jgi:hypothetical protein
MNDTNEESRTKSKVDVKPCDNGVGLIADIEGIPAAGTGATEAEAVLSLAGLLGDFVQGHKKRIEELEWVLVANDIEIPGSVPGEPTRVARGAFSFGQALRYLKSGKKVARYGWNGKGMWLILVPAAEWHTSVGPNMSCVPNAHRLPFIAMKTVDDGLVPWLASQTDVLASDWVLVD